MIENHSVRGRSDPLQVLYWEYAIDAEPGGVQRVQPFGKINEVVEDCLQSAISCMADQKYDGSGRSGTMASVEKFTHGAVVNQLRHCNREIENDHNKDIDPSRTHLNFSLTPEKNMSDLAYYKQRKEELYCYGRADVKTMAGWIVTAPAELKTREEEINFFKSTYQFLENRYGKENVISAIVHYDEGKMEKCKDRWGEYIRDQNGEIQKELVLGRPHLHFNFIPVVEDKNKRHIQTEKICANDRLNKKELQHFHTDLQKHLDSDGIEAKVITGKTKAQGRNYTVEEMKERYETQKELERLREIERKYHQEHQRSQERGRW